MPIEPTRKKQILKELADMEEQFYDELLAEFRKEVIANKTGIENALLSGDLNTALRLAHNTKGTSANLRLNEIAEKAEQTECLVRARRTYPEISPLLEEIIKITDELCR